MTGGDTSHYTIGDHFLVDESEIVVFEPTFCHVGFQKRQATPFPKMERQSKMKKENKKVKLSDWESNPGLPRDRRRY